METKANEETAGIVPIVSGLDLGPILAKLGRDRGWSHKTLEEGERQYKMFWTLKVLHPDEDLVPTKFIDEVWHAHILDTGAYATHCGLVFGYFLDHYPYLGVGGDDASDALDGAFEGTARLWAAEFGEDYRSMPIPGDALADLGGGIDGVGVAARCAGHACHAPSECACRTPGACK